jgi:aminoglycoside 6-adenylyltransferase
MSREPADHLLQRVCAWGKAQPDIRALIVTGSYARGGADALSDLDLEIFTRTPDRYLQSDSWMTEIGPVCVYLALENDRGLPTRLIIFKDGSKVDFTVSTVAALAGMVKTRRLPTLYERGYRIVVDKDQAASRLPQASFTPPTIQAPTEEEFTQTIHEFWFEVYHVANYLQRNDLWAAKVRDWRLKELLLKMIEWYEKSLHGWDYDTGHHGTRISEWVEPDVRARLHGVFADFDVADSQRALQIMIDIFRDITHDTAGRLRHHYPEDIERCLRGYVASLSAQNTDTQAG